MTTYNVTGVDDTGVSDATAGILAFIATCADGTDGSPNTILFGAGKTYRIDGVLAVTNRNHLIIDGNGSTFQTDDNGTSLAAPLARTRSHWRLTTCDDIRLTNGIIRGPNPNGGLADNAYVSALESQHGFEVLGCTDSVIDAWNVSLIYGDWVYLGVSASGAWTDRFTVDNCTFSNNGRQGFGIVGARHVEIKNCTTGYCRRSLIDLEPNSSEQGTDEVWIHHNNFGYQRLSFIASKGYPGPCHNVIIEDNTLAGTMFSEINPTGYGLRNNWTIRRNVAASPMGTSPPRVIKFERTDGIVVTDNVQPMQVGRGMYLVATTDCTDITVTGNTGAFLFGQYYTADSPNPGSDPTEGASTAFVAPTVEWFTSAASLTGSITVTIHASAEVDDLVFAQVAKRGPSYLSVVDSSWIPVTNYDDGSGTDGINVVGVFRRVLTAADITAGSFTFTMPDGNSTNRSVATLIGVRGYASPEPDFATFSIAGSVAFSIAAPAATTLTPNSLVLYFPAQGTGNAAITLDQFDMTLHGTVRNFASAGYGIAVASVVYEGIGTGRTRTFSSAASGQGSCSTIVVGAIGPPPYGERPRFNLTITAG